MGSNWAHMGTSILASFLASLVECVEALTVVLAVGSVRGWRSALTGTATAIVVLLIIIATLGTALAHIPLPILQLAVGTLLLLFGLRWLRKAILRSAGQIPLHDEQAAFAKNTEAIVIKLRRLLRHIFLHASLKSIFISANFFQVLLREKIISIRFIEYDK